MDYYNGFFGIVILILDIWALIHIVGSARSIGAKVFWVVIVLLLPILGFILWLIFGPRAIRTP